MKLRTHLRNVFFLLLSMQLPLGGAACAAQEETTGAVRCIVIDPGHGGKDPGAVGNGQQEKAINLGIALKLGRLIEKQLPDVRVVYTRRDDRFIALDERSKIAKQADGDLFVSIHTNASPNRSASGTETYVMGEDKGNENLSVVMRENAVIGLEADYTSRYEGYDPNSSESLILFSLMQYAYRSQSLSLAQQIQDQYVSRAKRQNKGVKQAGFLVLWRTPMPSVLTEVGFISNPEEAKYLGSQAGQEEIAAALFRAVKAYKTHTDSRALATPPPTKKEPAAKPAEDSKTPSKTPQKSAQKTTPKPVRQPTPEEEPQPAPAAKREVRFATPPAETTQPRPAPRPARQQDVVYRIQLKSALARMRISRTEFGPYADHITEMRIDGRYKYFYGKCFSYEEALLLQKEVRRTFPDAFMVAFRHDDPIPLAEAIGR